MLIHHLLIGQTPFDAESDDEAFDLIMDYAHGDPGKRKAAQEELRDTMVDGGVSVEACAVIGALMDASERTRLGSGVRCTMAPLEEHAFFTSEPAWEWEALSTGRLAPPPLPWDKACPSSHARNCHGEYKHNAIAAERAVAKWSEVLP